MKVAFLDSTAVVQAGPGSPAYFSRFVIERLRQLGHEILIAHGFDEDLCSEADLTVCEWANEDAYRAAASGMCKRLVVRMRGFDAHGPLDKLVWSNVDALVYESDFLQKLVEEDFGHAGEVGGTPRYVIPSGIDLSKVAYLRRNDDVLPVVAFAARTTNDKGLQLIYEWARQQHGVRIHGALALPETSPRLAIYLEESLPKNVTLWPNITDVPAWLNEIGATHILSASIWETLGYTIVEGMAVGCRPLVHTAPGTKANWPAEHLWTSFADLNRLLVQPIDSDNYREYVEKRYDAAECSQKFIELIGTIDARKTVDLVERRYTFEREVLKLVDEAQKDLTKDVRAAAARAEEYRRRWPAHAQFSEFRYGVATTMASAFGARHDLENAAVWAARAMLDAPWPDAMCIMGEVAAERGDVEQAVEWYQAANAVEDPPRRLRVDALVESREARWGELLKQSAIQLKPLRVLPRCVVVVTVRNANKWIEKCLASIGEQLYLYKCVVIDDVSTDNTGALAERFAQKDARFRVVRNTERKYQARNTVEGARLAADDENDIVVLVDGDDWLEPRALIQIVAQYARGAWMTYGNFVTSSGKRSHIGAYPQHIARTGEFANWAWQATAPRTFRRFLLDRLVDDDFKADGEWPKLAGDVSVMLPLLQLACERAVPITDPIYVYNDETPDSDHKQDAMAQVRVRDVLMQRPKKARLS